MTTRSNTPAARKLSAHETQWVRFAYTEMERILRNDQFRDDIYSDFNVVIANDLKEVMRKYPEPALFVRVQITHRRIDAKRRDNAQRGAGAHGGRVVQGFGPGDESGIDHRMYVESHEQALCDISTADLLSQSTIERLGHKAYCLFMLREVMGYETLEAAQMLNVSRAHASRLIHQALRALRKEFGA